MGEEFDSGDDLFDDVDEKELLQASQNAASNGATRSESRPAKHKRDGDDKSSAADQPPAKRQVHFLGSHPKDDPAKLELAQRLLSEKFKFKEFRHEQKAAIQRILEGENVLVVFPTGAGKSLCYQIPAIAFPELDAADGTRESSGVTIVVSPLIALMKDQVDALRSRGIAADCLDSTKTWEEVQLIHAALRHDKLRILYCAPERLNNEGFFEIIKSVPGGIRLLAVDEAHCISEWGHSFRPDYLKVARFVKEIQAERVICLTATATPKVADDIRGNFGIDKSCVFRTSPYRPNLKLQAQLIDDSVDKNKKWETLFTFLNANPGPTLVYVTLQEQATNHAMTLKRHGFSAEAFHASIKVEDKQKVQNDFMTGRTRIVCATIAFGMGIDKPDIRNVVHWDLSSSVEEYSQQVGRAGRDGLPSNCMAYISPGHSYTREVFARSDLPSRHSLFDFLTQIFRESPVDGVLKFDQRQQGKDFDIRDSPLKIIYAILELRFGLIRAVTPEYKSYTFEAMPSYYPTLKKDETPEAEAILSFAVKKAKLHHINVNEAVRHLGLDRSVIVRKLNMLNGQGHIKLKASGVEYRYRVLKDLPKTRKEISDLTDKIFVELQSREKDALQRTDQVTNLITGSRCFALSLAQHFGMGLPSGKLKCGHCTYCLTGEPVHKPREVRQQTTASSIQCVLAATDVRDDSRFLARVAFGIKSPRVTALRLDKSPVFGSLNTHNFDALAREFSKVCKES